MGGQLNKSPRATIQIDPHSEQATRDTALSEEPLVQRFEDAPQNEGGAGCTVAYLR